MYLNRQGSGCVKSILEHLHEQLAGGALHNQDAAESLARHLGPHLLAALHPESLFLWPLVGFVLYVDEAHFCEFFFALHKLEHNKSCAHAAPCHEVFLLEGKVITLHVFHRFNEHGARINVKEA